MVSRAEEHLNPDLPRLRVFPDESALAREGAAIFVERIREKVLSQGHASVILAGGGSPRLLYAEAGRLFSEWPASLREKVLFVPGDERMVRSDDPQSNSRMIRETLLSGGEFPEMAFERIRGESVSLESEALRYERVLLDRFKTTGLHVPSFDWAFLGVGEDGLPPGEQAKRVGGAHPRDQTPETGWPYDRLHPPREKPSRKMGHAVPSF